VIGVVPALVFVQLGLSLKSRFYKNPLKEGVFDRLSVAGEEKDVCNKRKEERLINELDLNLMPRHIAIIMDGNGRWAQKRGLPRTEGHRAGTESLKKIVTFCGELKIPILTVYAFSTENWKRPPKEVNILMDLLVEYINKEIDELDKNDVRINIIGDVEGLPQLAKKAVISACKKTQKNKTLILNVALNYGGRAEMVHSVRLIAGKVARKELCLEDITEETISDHLYTAGLPDPDLLIRTSGDFRVSNFLLWQIAYTEFWITPVLWPDFGRLHLLEAIISYQKRERRFGGLMKSQVGENHC